MGANFNPVGLTVRALCSSQFPSSMASESQKACFNVVWLCSNRVQRITLTSLLGLLAGPALDEQERSEALDAIDLVLHMRNKTEDEIRSVDTFITLLRDLTAPVFRAMLVLAQRGCHSMDTVGSLSDLSMDTVNIAPRAESSSHDSSCASLFPAETPPSSTSVTTNSETKKEMQTVVEDGITMQGNVWIWSDTPDASSDESLS
jgi:hypothetical protein